MGPICFKVTLSTSIIQKAGRGHLAICAQFGFVSGGCVHALILFLVSTNIALCILPALHSFTANPTFYIGPQ